MKRKMIFVEDSCYIEVSESIIEILVKYFVFSLLAIISIIMAIAFSQAGSWILLIFSALCALVSVVVPLTMMVNGGIRIPTQHTYCVIDRKSCIVTLAYERSLVNEKCSLGTFKKISIKKIVLRSGAKYHVKLIGERDEVMFHRFNVGLLWVDEDMDDARSWLKPLADWLKIPIEDNCA